MCETGAGGRREDRAGERKEHCEECGASLEAGWCHRDEQVEVEWKGRRCRRRSNPSLPAATRSLLTGMRLCEFLMSLVISCPLCTT